MYSIPARPAVLRVLLGAPIISRLLNDICSRCVQSSPPGGSRRCEFSSIECEDLVLEFLGLEHEVAARQRDIYIPEFVVRPRVVVDVEVKRIIQ
jgi:hypothetical protein